MNPRFKRSYTEEEFKAFKKKLNHAFRLFRREGLIAKQGFRCCSTCAVDALDAMLEHEPGMLLPKRGAVYFHCQDREFLLEDGELSIRYVANEWLSESSLAIGRQVFWTLLCCGLHAEWSGNPEDVITVFIR